MGRHRRRGDCRGPVRRSGGVGGRGEGERKSLATLDPDRLSADVDGMIAAFHHWRVVLISSLYGIGIGITPGVGASVACWLAYAQTARSVPSEVPYGEGALPGVIAPEAANNSKEGGAMIPTVFFGIPGSSSMAIMLGAFTLIGVRPGVEMLSKDATLAYLLGLSVIVANLLAVPFFLLATPACPLQASQSPGHYAAGGRRLAGSCSRHPALLDHDRPICDCLGDRGCISARRLAACAHPPWLCHRTID